MRDTFDSACDGCSTRDTLDLICDGLGHDHTHLELSVDYMKRRGNYFYLQPVKIEQNWRTMMLFGDNGAVRYFIDNPGRLDTKKLLAMREQIFANVDRDKLIQAYKERDSERIISLVIDALQQQGAA